jgi:hypothetical protein
MGSGYDGNYYLFKPKSGKITVTVTYWAATKKVHVPIQP